MKPLTAKQMARIAVFLGWEEVSQTGSHKKFYNPVSGRSVPIPMHSGDLKEGTQRGIMRVLGISPDKLPALIKAI